MIERASIKNTPYIIGYHTQEFRFEDDPLSEPICCNDNKAWLGVGYYFWTELEFARYWGEDFKRRTGFYDVYKANLKEDKLINAVFSEEGYFFFRDKIEHALQHFRNKGFDNIPLYKIHKYLSEEIWTELGIEGIIYDDIPHNNEKKGRTYSEIEPLYYKKRIQIIIFELKNIVNFELFLESEEVN